METWLPTLITDTPEEGFTLAIRLSRTAVKLTQPSADVRAELRGAYERSAEALIAASQVVAINFQTVSAANDHWRDRAIVLDGSARAGGQPRAQA